MLEKMEIIFPKNYETMEFFNLMVNLLKNIDYVTTYEEEKICMETTNLKPAIVLKQKDISNIQWEIGNQKYLDFLVREESNREEHNSVKRLLPQEVLVKLSGHVTRIDHIGINFPTNLYTQKEWDELLQYFSSVSNVYAYPTGEPWPFLLPATKEENEKEITNFEIIREPRLEFVFDKYTNKVTIHIDIETDLIKEEVEALFPKEEGDYFENLANRYKAIYLAYNQLLDIRLDIRYKCMHNDFESGRWFVTKGKRL